ncbi:uncharacterized protein EV154DRAFT_530637 [Mucor mucedo]|uniref:uncharacterized protein n=1 Tax=Mucor mucedo TaxID=29922 RepID=UPI00221FFF42|nr:uncharacterized protein EV154DRAFT_530637 [Mucor mucedo]KAI7869618.1 hypothetical protein EV154DRAFT_530637 [Mucor mucedo]
MGLFSEESKTSITLYIENLSNYEEIEWYQFEQLTESVSMQPAGAREAIEAVRKKLKHGTTQQKLRVLEVLKLLMENSNGRFHRELISNEKMKERFEMIIESPTEDMNVRKTIVSLLGIWATKFKGEQGMQILYRLHERGRALLQGQSSQRGSPLVAATSPADRYPGLIASPDRRVPPPNVRHPPTNYHQDQPYTDIPPPNDIGPRRQSNGSSTFDFEKAKPKIMQEVALATQSANNLVNALRLINTNKDGWELDMRRDRTIAQMHGRCEEEKKKIVRYARLVEDEEWIGTLLSANEDLLKALDMYDIMLTGQIPVDFPTSPYRANNEPLALPSRAGDADLLMLSSHSGDTHLPRDENGDILEDPFADPI